MLVEDAPESVSEVFSESTADPVSESTPVDIVAELSPIIVSGGWSPSDDDMEALRAIHDETPNPINRVLLLEETSPEMLRKETKKRVKVQ